MSPLLQMRGVRLVYGRRHPTLAIERLDLEIEQGRFVAVVGPSGCGKSSLMKLVTGLRRPSAGSIEVAGKEVDGPLKIVGMAFQNPTLLPPFNASVARASAGVATSSPSCSTIERILRT